MKQNKVWFVGFTSRLWVPVSIEGWLVSALFFTGIFLIGEINHVSSNDSLTLVQGIPVVIEFICLLVALYFVTKDHVDKRY